MKKKEYEAKRRKLLDEAQQLINEGKGKEAQEKMNEIKDLDEMWDAIAQAQANFNALNKDPDYKGVIIENGAFDAEGKDEPVSDLEKAWASKEYEYAWAKSLMGKTLNDKETEQFNKVNEAYTHTTENTGIVIPKSVSGRIWELAAEMYPFFADVAKTYVNGLFSIIQEDTSSEAGWYEEGTETEDGKETFKEFSLSGCELSRAITVSWKLKEMAIEDFIPYIERRIAKKMGAAAGYGATHGKGKRKNEKPEPTGVVTALNEEKNKSQIVTYEKGKVPSYAQVTNARSNIKSGYGRGAAIYANSYTVWNVIANIMDDKKRPLFVADPMTGGFRVLGMQVKEDDSMLDGEILMSNAYMGYHNNTNKEITMTTEDHGKKRQTDYCGYAIMDGNIITEKAHALLQYAEAQEAQKADPPENDEDGQSS